MTTENKPNLGWVQDDRDIEALERLSDNDARGALIEAAQQGEHCNECDGAGWVFTGQDMNSATVDCPKCKPAAPQVQADPIRAVVQAAVDLMEAREWAEHFAECHAPGDELASRFEACITDLHNEAYGGEDRQVQTEAIALSDEQRDAIREVMELARDEGLPGTAETLQSIISTAQVQADAGAVRAGLLDALRFYANGSHFTMHDSAAWDTVSGEPPNFYEDESNTATVEDGSIAKLALQGKFFTDQEYTEPPVEGEVFGVMSPAAESVHPDHLKLLRPFMSARDGRLTHSLTVYLREMADPEFAKRTHEARKRLYGAAGESDKRDAKRYLSIPAEVDAAIDAGFAESKRESEDAEMFRFLCAHPDWKFIEDLCRSFVGESAETFYQGLKLAIRAAMSREQSGEK